MTSPCEWTRSRLGRFVDDELVDDEFDQTCEHLSGCAECRAALEEERSLTELVLDAFVPVVASSGFDRWKPRLEEPSPTPISVVTPTAGRSARIVPLRGLWGALVSVAAVVAIAILVPIASDPDPTPSRLALRVPAQGGSVRSDSAQVESAQSDPTIETDSTPSAAEAVAALLPTKRRSTSPLDLGPGIVNDLEAGLGAHFVSLGWQPSEDDLPTVCVFQVELAAGDLDGDGALTIADLGLLARLVHRESAGNENDWPELAHVCPAAGDLDGDGALTPTDYSTATKMWISDAEVPNIPYRAEENMLACSIVCP